MKNRLPKFITLSLILSLFFTLLSTIGAYDTPTAFHKGLSVDVASQIAAQNEAVDNAVQIKSTLLPGQYGGMWIDDNQKLNIGVTNKDYMNFVRSENVIFHEFCYSLEELLQFKDTISTMLSAEEIECQSVMLDESQNAIIVTFDKEIEPEVMLSVNIKRYVDSKILIIEFNDSPMNIELQTVYN
jgi:hypothetical protein